MSSLEAVYRIYAGADRDATTRLYDQLFAIGPAGAVAVNLFRACKASERAKVYRGGPGRGQPSYKRLAYERKGWAIGNLTQILDREARGLGLKWGWLKDPKTPAYPWVLYVETPVGQCSFHNGQRGNGPMFPGQWNLEKGTTSQVICRWAAALLDARPRPLLEHTEAQARQAFDSM